MNDELKEIGSKELAAQRKKNREELYTELEKEPVLPPLSAEQEMAARTMIEEIFSVILSKKYD